jgi:D-alanyl-D-alanine carboxypeptidase
MNLTSRLEAAAGLIDRWLAYQVYTSRIPGLSVGIVYQDHVILGTGYGYANIADKVKATDRTCYRIASFSKVFTAIAIMQLFEQGKLNLDERVQRYVPWCRSEHDSETEHMTIRQLLSHTSGMIRDGNLPQWIDYHFPVLEQFQQQIAQGSMTYLPAVRWKYSNMGYALLGAIIQAVSGVSYDEYVTKHIVKRLSLTHTAPTLTDEIVGRLALGYSREVPEHERETFPHIETNVMSSTTGFSSNIVDFCQFMMALFDEDTRLLDSRTKREMRRVQWVSEGPAFDWCLGFEAWKVNQSRYYGHAGDFCGYRSQFGFDPESKIGLVIFANAMDAPARELTFTALRIIDYVITHFSEFASVAQTAEQIKRYEGIFRNIWGDIAIVAVDKQLLLYSPESRSPEDGFSLLRYDRGDQFTVVSGDDIHYIGETVRFEFDDQGVAQNIYVGPNSSQRLKFGNMAGE